MHSPADDARLLRRGMEELEADAAQAAGDAAEAGDPTETILVQITFDGPGLPASSRAVFAAKKVEVTVDDEVVGATVSLTTTGEWFPVVHVGPAAPSVGDVLFATRIDGLWVTRKAQA
jgi:hypothetical protein